MSLQVGMLLGRKDWGPRALLEAPFSADPCCRWELCVGLIEKRAAARGNFQNKEITTSWSTEIFKSPPPCPWAVQSCTSEHLATGGVGLTHLSWNFFSPPSMLRLQIAITSGFFFKEEGACAGVCALSLKKINLSGCSAALLFIFHFQHFKENNCRG